MVINSNSPNETKIFAKNFAKKKHKEGCIIALSGDLGAGKTTFVQGFATGLGITEKIISPTFVLIRQHQIPQTKSMLFHIDLYRLENDIHIAELGINEMLNNNNIILIEWAEKVKKQLPLNTIWIRIEKISDTMRTIEIQD